MAQNSSSVAGPSAGAAIPAVAAAAKPAGDGGTAGLRAVEGARGRTVEKLGEAVQDAKSAAASIDPPKQAQPSTTQFVKDPETGRMVVRFLDQATGEIVSQLPSEDALAVARAIGRLQGAFLEDKA